MNTVSVYSREGWIEDLPDLLFGRDNHGCGHYVNDDHKMVIFHIRKQNNVHVLSISRFIW